MFPFLGAAGADDACVWKGLAGARGALRGAASGAAATLVFATDARFDDVPQPAKAEMTTAAMMTSLLPARVRKMSIELP